jgi:OpgC protein
MRLNLSRLHFIDFARTFAVILALLAHSLSNTKVLDRMGADSLYIKQFTRTATPIFVFMFGFMIEFVYATRARASGVTSIQRRLRVRSFQCYFGYCLMSFDYTYRRSNMPGYYLIGIVTSVFWITLFSLLIGTRELSRPVKFFLPLGLSSLFSYTTGNVPLNLSGYVATRVDPTLYIVVFFVSVLSITKYIDRIPYYEYANELMCLRFPRRAHAEASLPAGQRPRSE